MLCSASRRHICILIVVATLFVAVPLGVTSYRATKTALENRAAAANVTQWLQGTSYQVVGTTVNGRFVTASIDGIGELQPMHELADALAATLGRPVVLRLRVIPSQIQESGG
jgi:hypothetical protein